MTDAQLYLAIGVPVALNGIMLTLALTLAVGAINKRMDDLRDLWRAELRRVEDVLDARLRLIEDKLGIR